MYYRIFMLWYANLLCLDPKNAHKTAKLKVEYKKMTLRWHILILTENLVNYCLCQIENYRFNSATKIDWILKICLGNWLKSTFPLLASYKESIISQQPKLLTHLHIGRVSLTILPRLQHRVKRTVRVVELSTLQLQEERRKRLLKQHSHSTVYTQPRFWWKLSPKWNTTQLAAWHSG